MANIERNSDLSAAARLSDFAFGLPDSETYPQSDTSDEPASPKPRRKNSALAKTTDLLVVLLVVGAVVVSCFEINSKTVVTYAPELAALLHLAAPAPASVASGAEAYIKVWTDRDTALYYCPGSNAYGRTRNGRYMQQAEAQLANFEPAERRECTTSAGPVARAHDLAQR
ncbi:MAG TPA: hypothetical protein VKT29_02485 [Terriglobales bacterium]|nr:hypothetical protein [Terriglobales bacterium]